MIEINTFEDLLQFIEQNDLTHKQISDIVQASTNSILINKYERKEDLIHDLKQFWSRWKNHNEKPIFINCDISVQE